MREVNVQDITDAVREMAIDVNLHLSEGLVDEMEKALEREESPLGRDIIERIIDNAETCDFVRQMGWSRRRITTYENTFSRTSATD